MRRFRFLFSLGALAWLTLAAPGRAAAYSVLTHQALVDSAWTDCLLPLLERRYPRATPAELETARSYAYGGAIVQDMGYYPLGTALLTNLMHYVRSGAFVGRLLTQAHDRNEYAVGRGALAHYAADNVGHAEATNAIAADVYPDLRAEFGPVVTYEQAPVRHTELEFSFDVVQVAAGRYRTQDYHKAIGFRVSKDLLERAFRETYGLKMGEVLLNVDLSIATFRFTVNHLMPSVARAAWHSQRRAIRQVSPGARRRDYVYHASRRAFRREFGRDYERPGFGARLMARAIGVLPKIGPLQKYAFTLPSPAGEATFRRSFADARRQYCALVARQPADTAARPPALPDTNLDTGRPTRPAAYALADQTYRDWLRKLEKDDFKNLPPAARQDLLAFFAAAAQAGPAKPAKAAAAPDAGEMKDVAEALEKLGAKK